MSTLASWLVQLRQGALTPAGFRQNVQTAVAEGRLDRVALRAWLETPAVKAALPAQLYGQLSELAGRAPPLKAPAAAAAPRNGKPAGPASTSQSVPRRPAATAGTGTPAPAPAPAPTTAPELRIGMVIDGRYELMMHIGGGGMGDVFKALDKLAAAQRDPDPYVAVKILKSAMQSNQKAVMALQREANRARRLAHANILRVHQFEQDRETGQYFMVMEMLEGRSIESVMYESRNGQPWPLIAPLIGQICAGLTCAHEQGIIHSDIKPSNLFLTRRREIKILDFGIAAPIPNLSGHETLMDARKLGARTPAYASMETFMGMKPHYSDDVYSLACLTYEWLCARPPYARQNEPYVPVPAPAALKLGLEAPPISSLTRAQNKALRKALALKRVERTQTIGEFWRSMNQAHLGVTSRGGLIAAGVAGVGLAALGVAAAFLRPHGSPVEANTPPSPVDQAVALACHSPAVQETLERAIGDGRRAQETLEAHPAGSSQHGPARASAMKAVQCLTALERAGYSDARSAAVLRELQARVR